MNFNHLPVARKLWGLVLGLLVSMLLLLAGLLAYTAQLNDEAARIVQANEDRISLALRWKGLTTLALDQSVSALASADETLASDLQKLVLRLRDQHCRFPGCSRPAERCEIDHATPYDSGGRTDSCNLGPLCKHHHEMKTAGYWHITASHRNGACTWRSPLGRVYQHEPPDLIPPPPPRPPADPPPF